MSPRLNTPLLLEQEARTDDGAGGYVREWEALGTLWAEVTPGSGGVRDRAGLPTHRQAFRITVRAAPHGAGNRPVPGQRFRAGERVFLIDAVQESDATARYLLCRAREEVQG